MTSATRSPTSRVRPWQLRLGRLWSRALGWTAVDEMPPGLAKAVVIAAPHTSNWDLLHLLGASWLLGRRLCWMGKHTLFRGPMGWLMRRVGGIPVDRRSPEGVVGAMVERFAEAEHLLVVIAPTGSRGRTDFWKSGFYRIAHAAGVPIVCGFLDYPRRRAGLGLTFVPTGDPKRDMDRIRQFYRGIQGLKPENTGEMRLRDEALGFPSKSSGAVSEE